MPEAERITGRVRLRKEWDRKRESGYLWAYAGEIDAVTGNPVAGDVVEVCTQGGHVVGHGLFNPHSKIRVRLLSFHNQPLDEGFWRKRIGGAVALRQRVVADTNAYRLIHGESDLLPGLIVDRFGDLLVMQTLSFGMDRRKEMLADLLTAETGVKNVYLRNDGKSRLQEGLSVEQRCFRGQFTTVVEIDEMQAKFFVDVARGQKTGWFCDQRENRSAVAVLGKGVDVLDVFCHTGGFGIQAALHGAASVVGLDVSAEAIKLAQQHAVMNGVGRVCVYREADALDELRAIERSGRRYGMVILDPPAFARSKQAVPHALAGYKDVNLRAMRAVQPEGFVVSCSCSHHVSERALWETIRSAAHDAKRQLRLLEVRSQSRDHPVLAAMPETKYLKCFVLQVF
ncbi:MAG: class I SAM-dependent rRNA methyltransferase [Nitrospiraceae bacterium]